MELKELGLQSRTVNALAKKKLYTVNDMAMFVREFTGIIEIQNISVILLTANLLLYMVAFYL